MEYADSGTLNNYLKKDLKILLGTININWHINCPVLYHAYTMKEYCIVIW
jgi:hypothetical protein